VLPVRRAVLDVPSRRDEPRRGSSPRSPTPARHDAGDLSRFFGRLYPQWDGASSRPASRGSAFRETSLRPPVQGQKGMVQLALALASRPDLLALDDPTLGLDPVARREIYEQLVAELADRARRSS